MSIILRTSFLLATISFVGWLIALLVTDFAYPDALLYAALAFFVFGFWISIKDYAVAVGDEWSND